MKVRKYILKVNVYIQLILTKFCFLRHFLVSLGTSKLWFSLWRRTVCVCTWCSKCKCSTWMLDWTEAGVVEVSRSWWSRERGTWGVIHGGGKRWRKKGEDWRMTLPLPAAGEVDNQLMISLQVEARRWPRSSGTNSEILLFWFILTLIYNKHKI